MNPDDEFYGEWPPIRCVIVNLDEISAPASSSLKTICGKPLEPGCVPSIEEWSQDQVEAAFYGTKSRKAT